MQISAVGIAWYRSPEDYDSLRAVFTDSDTLPDTYDDWLAKAEQLEKQIKAQHGRPIRAYIDPVNFPKWCKENGYDLNSQGRSEFGNSQAAKVIFKERSAKNGSEDERTPDN